MEYSNTSLSLGIGFVVGIAITEIAAKAIVNNTNKQYLYNKVEECCNKNGIQYDPNDYQFNFI